MSASAHEALVIVKRDAIEDGLALDIINFINRDPQVDVTGQHAVDLTVDEILSFYEPELVADPSERRQILMAMGAQAMAGVNLFVGVKVNGIDERSESFVYLNSLKGSINDSPSKGTVRGTFPFRRPEGFDALDFWFQAPFFVRNRLHVPDSADAVQAVEAVAELKGIARGELYGQN